MSINYRNLSTPFFKVWVSDSQPHIDKEMMLLPRNIMRTLESVEIYEAMFSAENPNDFSKITLRFVGYIIDSLTGKYMPITEARFPMNYLNRISANEIRTKEYFENEYTETTTVGGNVEVKSNVKRKPLYLLHQRNQVKVTWGYVDGEQRSVRGYIQILSTEFPESGLPVTTVTIMTKSVYDQMSKKDKSSQHSPDQKGNNGRTNLEVTDKKTAQILKEMSDSAGLTLISSKEFLADQLADNHIRFLATGEGFLEYLQTLAKLNNAYFNIHTNPATGVDVLTFISQPEFERQEIVNDSNLFKYRSPGSIVKSINVAIDYSIIGGAAAASQSDTQGIVSSEQDISLTQHRVYPSYRNEQQAKGGPVSFEEFINWNPATGDNYIPACARLAKTGDWTTGRLYTTPLSEILSDMAEGKMAQSSNAVKINMVTLGYPKLTTGVINIQGIGKRYDGRYRALVVVHSISSKGYECRVEALKSTTLENGVKVSAAPKGESTKSQDGVASLNPVSQKLLTEGEKASFLTAFTDWKKSMGLE